MGQNEMSTNHPVAPDYYQDHYEFRDGMFYKASMVVGMDINLNGTPQMINCLYRKVICICIIRGTNEKSRGYISSF